MVARAGPRAASRAPSSGRRRPQPGLELGPAGLDRVQVGRVRRQVAVGHPAGSKASRTRAALCAARLSIITIASGRPRRAGMSTCSTKAKNTAVLVAAAMLMLAVTPSRPSAPSTVGRCQCPRAPCPRPARRARHGHGCGSGGYRSHSRPERPSAADRSWPARHTNLPEPRRYPGGPALAARASFLRGSPSFRSARHTVEPLTAPWPARPAVGVLGQGRVVPLCYQTGQRRGSRRPPALVPPRRGLGRAAPLLAGDLEPARERALRRSGSAARPRAGCPGRPRGLRAPARAGRWSRHAASVASGSGSK